MHMNKLRLMPWVKRCLFAVAAFGVAFAIGCATGHGQPHMAAALDELRAARGELQAAEADKGGHRVRAIELVDGAIEQVRRGIDYAATH
jgi:hypothetical protein